MRRNEWSTFLKQSLSVHVPYECLILSVALFGFEWLGWFLPMRTIGERTLLPIITQVSRVVLAAQEPFYVLTTGGVDAVEYLELQRRYATALVKITELEGVVAENSMLRETFKNHMPANYDRLISAPILTADGSFVSAGSADGVQNGSLVLANTVLVGIIEEVTAHQAKITSLQQIPLDRPILVKTEQGGVGLLHGKGKQVIIREVSRDSTLEIGDRVVSAGQEGIQSGLLIGTVRTVDSRPSSPTLSGVIDQPISLYEVALVEIW